MSGTASFVCVFVSFALPLDGTLVGPLWFRARTLGRPLGVFRGVLAISEFMVLE